MIAGADSKFVSPEVVVFFSEIFFDQIRFQMQEIF